MKKNRHLTLVMVTLACLALFHSIGVDSFPLTSLSADDHLWQSSLSQGRADEKSVEKSTGSSVTSSESSALPAFASTRNVDESLPSLAMRTRRTPTESSWPVTGHAANAQQVDLQQVHQSARSIPLETSQNEAHQQHEHSEYPSKGGKTSVLFARIMGDDDDGSLARDVSLTDGHNSLFDLSSLDSDTMLSMLNLIKNDPDTFNELIGVKSGAGSGSTAPAAPGDSSVSSNGKSRNSRNRAAYEADVLQKVLQVYQDKVAPKLLLVKRGEGPQLSVVSPLDVLRQQLLYELARRRSKELQEKIQVNEQLLKSLGKRSVDPNDGPDDSPQ